MSPGLNSKTLYVEQRVRQISSKEFAAYLHLVKFSQNDYGNMDTIINKFHSLERKMIPVWNHFPMHYCSFKMPGAKIDGKETLSLDRISNMSDYMLFLINNIYSQITTIIVFYPGKSHTFKICCRKITGFPVGRFDAAADMS